MPTKKPAAYFPKQKIMLTKPSANIQNGLQATSISKKWKPSVLLSVKNRFKAV